MSMKPIDPIIILDIPVHPYTMHEVIAYLKRRLEAAASTFVVTANAEIIMMCQTDAQYKEILQTADLVLPDGAGTVWAGKKLGYTVPERVAGFDLFLELMQLSSQHHYKVYFLGGAPGIAEAAKAKCAINYPGANIVGCRDGYFTNVEDAAIVDEINQSGAQILFLALGAPKQEKWYIAHSEKLQTLINMGIGGSFDVLAGKMERAPKWMQEASLEWLFRLYKQPSRFVRMMALPKFVFQVLSYKSYKNH